MTTAPLYATTQFPRDMRVADTTLPIYRVYLPTPVAGTVAVGADSQEEAEWNAAVHAADPVKVAAFKASIKAQVAAGQTRVLRAEDF